MKKSPRLTSFLIALVVVVVGIICYGSRFAFLDGVELKTIDMRFNSRGKLPPSPNITLVTVDEKSLNAEGRWVWPRWKIANLITDLSDLGARVIALDIGFFEPEANSALSAIDDIESYYKNNDMKEDALAGFIGKLTDKYDNDHILARSIATSKAKVVLGDYFLLKDEEGDYLSPQQIQQQKHNMQGAMYKIVQFKSEKSFQAKVLHAAVPSANIGLIADSTPYSGFFNTFPDEDGKVRWVPAVLAFQDDYYCPLSMMAVSAYLDKPLSLSLNDEGIGSVKIGDIKIPTDILGRMLINYRGPKKTFEPISATDVLHHKVRAQSVADKIVFVGVTAVGAYDLRVTPFDAVFPGTEIHANIVDTILSRDFLYQPLWIGLMVMGVMVFAGLFLGVVIPRMGAGSGAMVTLVVFGGYIVVCQVLFSQFGIIMNMIYPLSVILLAYLLMTVYRYFVEEKQKRYIRSAFSTYLAPAVVQQLIESPEKLVLGGERRLITAFFSDVQGFTSISEKLTPESLVDLLNEFLTEMTDIILKYEGTVDKFEGDAIIAFFGAPNDLENSAKVACHACIEMQQRLRHLRQHWRESGIPELRMRVGLNTGHAVVGNMGSKNRMDYTMMGDAVNTAARLEGVNKMYQTYSMISQDTFEAAGDSIVARELDYIRVVGKTQAVSVYELIGYTGQVDSTTLAGIEQYRQGLLAYRKREWDSALSMFQKTLEILPEDGPSRLMIRRCDDYKQNPPDERWDGAFVLKRK